MHSGSWVCLFPNAQRRVLVFVWGVWGQDRVHFDLGNSVANDRARPRTTAHVRWGLVGRAWSVWCRALVIGGGEPGLCGVVLVPL